uniref:hypothetical protein n=1 Tax=Sunxiuqinia rutila TaxID=1397841 RepID=UPI003D35DC6C
LLPEQSIRQMGIEPIEENTPHGVLTVTCMWSGGPDAIGSVRLAGKWAQGLTCQTAETPACHIKIVITRFLIRF